MKRFIAVVGCLVSAFSMAEGESNPWRFSVGPAWRSKVKASLSGRASVPAVSASHTVVYDKDVEGTTSWGIGDVVTVPDPDVNLPVGTMMYAVESVRTETTITPNDANVNLSSSDDDSPLGLKLGIGYDFYDDGLFTVGVDLRFAAFWDMESSVSGSAGGGTVRVQTTKDYYLFESGPYPDDTDFSYCLPSATPYLPYREQSGDVLTSLPSSTIRAALTSDLYQIGIGPRVGCHVFDWLDAYAGVSFLCNIASLDFDVKGVNESTVECRFGVGADVGLTAWVTDNFGLYAEVGYEWIDKPTIRNGDISAEVDYSSLIVCIGGVVRF